jgi:hypothetical protein
MQTIAKILGANGKKLPWEDQQQMDSLIPRLGDMRHHVLKLLHRDTKQRFRVSEFCSLL